MGLAASQARYLSLSARKSNCEYEGQQINQQRLNLSNQSADLFNQMLTMSVPMPPSTSDYTTIQYSWSDGNFTSVIDNYYQIGEPNEEFNYVVSSYHYENIYTGQKQRLVDPQVQATKTNHFTANPDKNYTVNTITYNNIQDTYTLNLTRNDIDITSVYKPCDQNTSKDVVEELDFIYQTDRIAATVDASHASDFVIDSTANTITYRGRTYDYIDTETASQSEVKNLKQTYGASYDSSKHYYKCSVNNQYICREDVENAAATLSGDIVIRKQDTEKYYTDGTNIIKGSAIQALTVGSTMTVQSATNNPTFSDYTSIGNCAVTSLSKEAYDSDLTIDTEIKQVIKDMEANGDSIAASRLKACFDDEGNYIEGSLYQFKMSGKIYYTTADDMDESLLSAYSEQSVANNSIDSQQSKLSYYDAVYLETKVTEVKKALMESDGKGRFSTVKFEDDSVVYTLNVETIKDEDAYNDAMNKYYYEKEQYDKQIADINAKTEVIQAQDRQLQLKLEQLGTEQTALQTEMEACQKVVSKNIENSFKTFNS